MLEYNVIFNTTGDPDIQFIGSIRQYSVETYKLNVFLPNAFDTGYQVNANIKRADDNIGSYALSWADDHWELVFAEYTTQIAGELQITITAVDTSDKVTVFKNILLNVEEAVATSDYNPEVDTDEYNALLAAIATKQNADADLTAIAQLTGTGVPKKTAPNTWALSTEYFELVDGKIPAEYLPEYVDDVIEGILVNSTTFTVGGNAVTPESGKLYVSTANERVYRWSGSLYVEISAQITVGNLTGQAFDGLLGKNAFDNAALAVSWGNHANASYLTASSGTITNITNNVSNLTNITNNLSNAINSTNSNVANLTNVVANKVDSSLVGANNGLATLDSVGKVPSSQLPSFVDDVLEYANLSAFPVSGETGKIYIAIDTGLTYRWSGSIYVEISQSLALGNTSSTAFRGDLGKEAYDWGNHANASYLTASSATITDIINNVANKVDTSLLGVNNGVATLNAAGKVVRTQLESAVYINTTAPSTPLNGDLWWNSSSGDLSVYYNDGDSSQWVDTSVSNATIDYIDAQVANKANWDTAFSWGNHQSVGYVVGLGNGTVSDGNIASWNGTTGKLLKDTGVPIANVVVNGQNQVTLNYVTSRQTIYNTTAEYGGLNAGEVGWSQQYGTLQVGLLNGAYAKVGQSEMYYGKATETITKGQVVMFNGSQGDFIKLSLANPSVINNNPDYMLGLATTNIANDGFGYVTKFGYVDEIATNGFTNGTIIWFDSNSSNASGGVTDVKPVAPNAKIQLAAVVKASSTPESTNGRLLVRVATGSQLGGTDSNVELVSATNNDILAYNGTSLRWENQDFTALDIATKTELNTALGDIETILDSIIGEP
jgi:hypothetical protein